MAKSNPLKDTDDSALPLTLEVVRQEAQSATLGQALSDLLEKSDDPLKVYVDQIARRIVAYPTSIADDDEINSGTLIGTLVRDDATKRTSPWTLTAASGKSGNGLNVALIAALSAAKPAKSIASLISLIEDSNLADGGTPAPVANLCAVIDQTGDGTVKIYECTSPVLGANTDAVKADITQEADVSDSVSTPLAFE